MYVNAAYAILCNNYGNNLILLSQTSLVFPQLFSRNPAAPPAEPPWVCGRAAKIGAQPLAALLPAELLAPLLGPPFSCQTTHTLPSSTDTPQI